MSTALSLLLKGDIVGSFRTNPMTIILILAMGIYLTVLMFKKRSKMKS